MKQKSVCQRVGILLYLLILFTACVNRISENGEQEDYGKISVKLMPTIQSGVATRIANNKFEVGDSIGVYAMLGSGSLEGERYADNLAFGRSSEDIFVPNVALYYPEQEFTLNLISYYPYGEKGVAFEESSMLVGVKPDQSVLANYSASDFLVALLKDVRASKDPVKLTYKHRFFRLKIVLIPGKGEDAEQMLGLDPKLEVCGFFTKAFYDFNEEEYTNFCDEENITPAGEWSVSDGKLVGKELILVPQQLSRGHQQILLEVAGKTYTALLPSALELQAGKQQELQISFVSDEDILLDALAGEIADWEGSTTGNSEAEIAHKYINVSKLEFDDSQVYKVMSGSRQVAEVCKELLVGSQTSDQAIVAYPMQGDKKPDLSKGIVMQLIGKAGAVHGGTVAWDLDTHTLNYTAGTMPVLNYLSVLSDGRIALSTSALDDVLSITSLDDVIRDVRGGAIHNYPIVKIGTQYWMKSDLEASAYSDGEQILSLKEMHEGDVGYVRSAAGNYFYSASVAKNHRMLPNGWDIPNWEDWMTLISYLKSDVSTLKTGMWIPLKDGGSVAGASNLSGFSAKPAGLCFGNYLISEYEGRYVGYWTLDDKGGVPDEVLLFKSDVNEMVKGKVTGDKAYVIRGIRK